MLALEGPRRERALLALLTAAFTIAGLGFALATPLFANPDESVHVDMVRHYAHHPTQMAGPSLRQTAGQRGAVAAAGILDEPNPLGATGAIPSARPHYGSFGDYGGMADATDCPQRTCQNYHFIHPPGWYLLGAPVAAVLDGRPFPDTVLALRLLNVVLSVVIVPCTWFVALQLWPHRRRAALVAAGLMAICGPVAATAAAANNDGLLLPLMAVALALMAGILRHGATVRWSAALGAVVTLGLLTKGQFLLAAVAGLAAVLLAPLSSGGTRLHPFLAYAAAGAPGGLYWLPTLLRTHSTSPGGSEFLADPRPGPWNHVGYLEYFGRRAGDLFDSLPGSYGYWPWRFGEVPTPLLRAGQLGLVALLLAWALLRRWRRPTIESARVLVVVSLPAMLLMSIVATSWQAYRDTGYEYGLAARYLYGAAPVFAVMITAGLLAVSDRLRPALTAPLHAAMLPVTALLGTGVAFVVALHAKYFTTDLTLLFQRGGVVAPLPHLKAQLLVLVLAWVAAVGGASGLALGRIGGTALSAGGPAGGAPRPRHAARSAAPRHRAPT